MNNDLLPNLDCMEAADLLTFAAKYQHPARRDAAALFGSNRKGYVKTAKLLACYASNKATAQELRLKGEIGRAVVYETICEGIYRRLPDFARW